MATMAARDYVIEEYTRTVCPQCFEEGPRRSDDPGTFIDGMLVSRDGSIWMRRWCPKHGESESLYEEDAEIWHSRFGWSTPTLAITPDRPDNTRGCPGGYADGLPASHGQHTCILLANVTDHCNYRCPTCYASALEPGTPAEAVEKPTITELLHTVDTMIAREGGRLGVVMVSGGEPTVRRDIEALLDQLTDRPITRVMLNTNGRRIARDDKFLKFLSDRKHRIEVYLQFDGLRSSTHLALRGEDLTEEKPLALRRLNEAGVFATLVTTVARGVNEDEIGDLIHLGLETPRCTGMAIQPMFGSGRRPDFDPRSRATPTGVLKRLNEQTNGLVQATDFIPLPCSHKDCCDIGYFIQTKDGWQSLTNLIGRAELKNWIHLVANTISFESASSSVKEMLRSGAIQRVFSEQQKVGAAQLARDMMSMCQCVPGIADMLGAAWSKLKGESAYDKLVEKTFRVTVKMFMDAHTFHEARIRQCCVHVGTFEEDPRRYSFCWRWLFADSSDRPGLTALPMVR
ncbi:MAG: radical SAM protein [Fimbriimonadaceae bacterium]|nr:radical SAM protein [Fimbriimonadaceae bacterium]